MAVLPFAFDVQCDNSLCKKEFTIVGSTDHSVNITTGPNQRIARFIEPIGNVFKTEKGEAGYWLGAKCPVCGIAVYTEQTL